LGLFLFGSLDTPRHPKTKAMPPKILSAQSGKLYLIYCDRLFVNANIWQRVVTPVSLTNYFFHLSSSDN